MNSFIRLWAGDVEQWMVLVRDTRFNNSSLICRYSQQRIMEDYCVSATMTATHNSPNITDHDLHCGFSLLLRTMTVDNPN